MLHPAKLYERNRSAVHAAGVLLLETDRAYIVFVFSYTVYFAIYNNLVMCSQYKKLLGACTITDRNYIYYYILH